MFEYTKAWLTPFKWARAAYDYTLGLSTTPALEVLPEDLTGPTLPNIPTERKTIKDDIDWNAVCLDQHGDIFSIYASVDQADVYTTTMRSLMESRVSESERRVQQLEAQLRSLRSETGGTASTSIVVRGGEENAVETDVKYYQDIGKLRSVIEEGCFRLADNGFFSTIRSQGGFAGKAVIEKSLGEISQTGTLDAISDGTRSSFWMGTSYAPGPVRGDVQDIPWLPSDYKFGFAFMLTYYLDRPSYASEVYIDPITTEPYDLVAVSWTPYGVVNVIPDAQSRMEQTAGGWSLSGGAAYGATVGVSGSNGMICPVGGKAAFTFKITTAMTVTVSGLDLVPATGDVVGSRLEFRYDNRGQGDCRAGARIVWLDASGNPINYDYQEEYPTGFFASYRLVSFVPSLAVSGRVELVNFSGTPGASAYFDNAELYVGDQRWYAYTTIDRATTVPLPTPVLSGRYSFVFAQRSPRLEVQSMEAADTNVAPINNSSTIDPSIQDATQALVSSLKNTGTGKGVFAYRVGMRELDLRNRQYIPRGALVSIPINAQREIRTVWLVAETAGLGDDGSFYYVYPYPDDENFRVSIRPTLIGPPDDNGQTLRAEGDVLHVLTPEEEDAGWSIGLPIKVILEPKPLRETYDGTDREGKLQLSSIPHLRRPSVRKISDWVRAHAVWPTDYDPNAQTVVGVLDPIIRAKIRDNDPNWPINLVQISTFPGYIPIKVTVSTESFVAHPDTLGRPDLSRVRDVEGEVLDAITDSTEHVITSNDQMTLDQFVTAIKVGDLITLGAKVPVPPKLVTSFGDRTIKEALDGMGYTINANKLKAKSATTTTKKGQSNLLVNREQALQLFNAAKRSYERLKADGKLPSLTSLQTTQTLSIQRGDTFKTRFAPIISGPTGSFIKLYWRNPDTAEARPIPQSGFEIISSLGAVRLNISAPASGFSELVADYKYLSRSEAEDFFSQPLAAVNTGDGSAGLSDFSRSLPVTRNMTDYIGGRVPTLKEPNFDRLAQDYYPIIEYYVTPDGDIVFSRDFFKYGDMPATITVEWETLGVGPRMGVEVQRTSGPTISPSIYSISMRVREGAAAPIRENP